MRAKRISSSSPDTSTLPEDGVLKLLKRQRDLSAMQRKPKVAGGLSSEQLYKALCKSHGMSWEQVEIHLRTLLSNGRILASNRLFWYKG
jgi:hypothetical protein